MKETIIFDTHQMGEDEQDFVRLTLSEHEVDTDIIALCDIGFWDGRELHLVNISRTNNTHDLSWVVNTMMTCHTEIKAVATKNDIVMTESHHDATNYYIFRKMRKNSNFENMKIKISKAIRDGSCSTLDEMYELAKTRTTSVKKEVFEAVGLA